MAGFVRVEAYRSAQSSLKWVVLPSLLTMAWCAQVESQKNWRRTTLPLFRNQVLAQGASCTFKMSEGLPRALPAFLVLTIVTILPPSTSESCVQRRRQSLRRQPRLCWNPFHVPATVGERFTPKTCCRRNTCLPLAPKRLWIVSRCVSRCRAGPRSLFVMLPNVTSLRSSTVGRCLRRPSVTVGARAEVM